MSANPAIAIQPGRMVMPFGSPGSEVLGQAMVQAFLNQAVFGMDRNPPARRRASPAIPGRNHPAAQLSAGVLRVERDIGEATGQALAALGHRVEWWPERKYAADR